MRIRYRYVRFLLADFLAVALLLSLVPAASAAQQSSHHDPTENWKEALDRTNELDANAVVTHGTFDCTYCNQVRGFIIYRIPKYIRTGETALSRGVRFPDGTMLDGKQYGSLDDGTPGVDAYFIGYHWARAVCQSCGAINASMGTYSCSYDKSVYWLLGCAANFSEDLPESVETEQADREYHRVIIMGGQYCGFCYGTYRTEGATLERHHMGTSIQPELAHQRFVEIDTCADCGYAKTSYAATKAVVVDCYGVADGVPHTVIVSDLFEAGVTTAVRYGYSADAYTLTSALDYIEAGNYIVYHEIAYTHMDTDMVKDGVTYVHLTVTADGSYGYGCGDPDCDCQDPDCDGGCCNQDYEHHFVRHGTMAPGCMALGYDHLMCTECGKMTEANYKNSLGHAYQSVVVREATCETSGKTMDICERCGNVRESTIPQTEYEYETQMPPVTCTSPDYTLNECVIYGDRYVIDPTPAPPHDYVAKTIPADYETGGKIIHTCAGYGLTLVTDYTESLGHSRDEGMLITDATCTDEGIMEYTCTRCGVTRLEGDVAVGHTPGDVAACTTPQLCIKCGAVIENTLGHDYQEDVAAPTCTAMGFTTLTCSRCGDTYDRAYIDSTSRMPSEWIVNKGPDQDSAGNRYKECTVCDEALETEELEKLYASSTTDERGEAVAGRYLVIVTNTDSKTPVSGAVVELGGEEHPPIRLSDHRLLDHADQTTITVLLAEPEPPVEGLAVSVTDKNANRCGGKTDKTGQLMVPGSSGTINEDGNATVGYEDTDDSRWTLTVQVERTETGRPIADTAASVGRTGNITASLPKDQDMDSCHRVIVTVADQETTPQKNATVIVKSDLGDIVQGQTNKDGELTVPAADSAYTDDISTAVVGQYTVIVTDAAEKPVKGALVTLLAGESDEGNASTVLLPDGRLLDGNDQTVVTVLLPTAKPVAGLNVEVSDKQRNHAARDTDKKGQITVPDASGSAGEIIGTGTGDEDKSSIVDVDVADQDGKPVEDVETTVDKDSAVPVILPDDFTLDEDGLITVTATDNRGEAKPGVSVTVEDGDGTTAAGETGKGGKVTPSVAYHFAYLVGYGDGTIGPGRNMTRGETVAIFARVLSEVRGDELEGLWCDRPSDVCRDTRYADHMAYLGELGVAVGYPGGLFYAEATITREQLVAISIRLDEWMELEIYDSKRGSFPDIPGSHWAADHVQEVTRNGWIVGYADGLFHGGNQITRAEVAAIVNRMLGRMTGERLIRHNEDELTTLRDPQNPHYWAYYDLMEAANGYTIVTGTEDEIWHEVR